MPPVGNLHTVPRMATIGEVIANNVRAERARRRWSQTQLGDLIGSARSSVGDLESGRHRANADDMVALCRAFGITLAKLMDGADPEDLRTLGL
jgi:transcriptional regulator with XRE-family HTH domain